MTADSCTTEEVAAIKTLQRLAYDCAEQVAGELKEGVTEREAATRLGHALRAHGVDGFFHSPFAWFGDRAGFCGFASPDWRRPLSNVRFTRQFSPTERRLARGMIAILDVAPIRDGLCCDIGYTFAIGEQPALVEAMELLRQLRVHILEGVRAERTMSQIYDSVEVAVSAAGYECAHVLYPSRVLGHKIGRIPLPRLGAHQLAGFDLRTYLYFGRQLLRAVSGRGRTPLWNRSHLAAVRPTPGLWSIEPHVRGDGMGAKWEEILVVTDSDAYWLDDSLPHVRQHPALRARERSTS